MDKFGFWVDMYSYFNSIVIEMGLFTEGIFIVVDQYVMYVLILDISQKTDFIEPYWGVPMCQGIGNKKRVMSYWYNVSNWIL